VLRLFWRTVLDQKLAAVDIALSTREKLVKTALLEFNSCGFEATNTNKIARAAGYAPQTFYRHFENKLAAFIAAYEYWQQEELQALNRSMHAHDKHSTDVALTLLAFHQNYRTFRASLKKLAGEEPAVAAAREESRAAQVVHIAEGMPSIGQNRAHILAAILSVEAITDGVAFGHFDGYTENQEVRAGLIADAVQPLMPTVFPDRV